MAGAKTLAGAFRRVSPAGASVLVAEPIDLARMVCRMSVVVIFRLYLHQQDVADDSAAVRAALRLVASQLLGVFVTMMAERADYLDSQQVVEVTPVKILFGEGAKSLPPPTRCSIMLVYFRLRPGGSPSVVPLQFHLVVAFGQLWLYPWEVCEPFLLQLRALRYSLLQVFLWELLFWRLMQMQRKI